MSEALLIIWKLLFLTRVMPGILTWQFLLGFKTSSTSYAICLCARGAFHLFTPTPGNCRCEKTVRAGLGIQFR